MLADGYQVLEELRAWVLIAVTVLTGVLVPVMIYSNKKQHNDAAEERAQDRVKREADSQKLTQMAFDLGDVKNDISDVKSEVVGIKTDRLNDKQLYFDLFEGMQRTHKETADKWDLMFQQLKDKNAET